MCCPSLQVHKDRQDVISAVGRKHSGQIGDYFRDTSKVEDLPEANREFIDAMNELARVFPLDEDKWEQVIRRPATRRYQGAG